MITSILIAFASVFLFVTSKCDAVDSKCTFPDHNVLHKGMIWLPNIEGEIYQVKDDNETYLYSVGICITPNVSVKNLNLDFAAVIQQNLKTDNMPSYVIGRYNDSDIKIGTNWGFMEFGSGEKYTSHCGSSPRVTMLMITCNKKIEKPLLRIIEENNQKNNKCYYLFELEHPKMCNTSDTKEDSLGVVSIIVIIMVCLIAIYLGMGMAIKKVFYNVHGIEVIPNIKIWRYFGESFSNCVEKLCRPNPLNISYDAYNPVQRGNLTINDLEPDNLEDDEALVFP